MVALCGKESLLPPLTATLEAIVQTKDDGYVVAGYKTSGATMGTGDSFVAKLNSNGVVKWQKCWSVCYV